MVLPPILGFMGSLSSVFAASRRLVVARAGNRRRTHALAALLRARCTFVRELQSSALNRNMGCARRAPHVE